MLLGKEVMGFVKGLVTPNKITQGHITRSTSLHRVNSHVLQHAGQQQTAWAVEHVCIIRLSQPTNHCLRNKLFNGCQHR